MAREQLQRLRQGGKTVSEYADEFRSLAARVPEWTEVNRVGAFRDGLRRDILQQCLAQAHPGTLMGWIRLAGEIEGRMQILQLVDARDAAEKVSSKSAKKGDSRKREGARIQCSPVRREEILGRKRLMPGLRQKGAFFSRVPFQEPATIGRRDQVWFQRSNGRFPQKIWLGN